MSPAGLRAEGWQNQFCENGAAAWLGVAASKFYDWRARYGLANEHNDSIPRDWKRLAHLSMDVPYDGRTEPLSGS